MRTTEERMALISKRSEELKKEMNIKENARKRRAASGACVAACLIIVAGMGAIMPTLVDSAHGGDVTYAYGAASIISESPAAGYVILGLLSFALGVFATIAAFRLRGSGREEMDDNEHKKEKRGVSGGSAADRNSKR